LALPDYAFTDHGDLMAASLGEERSGSDW